MCINLRIIFTYFIFAETKNTKYQIDLMTCMTVMQRKWNSLCCSNSSDNVMMWNVLRNWKHTGQSRRVGHPNGGSKQPKCKFSQEECCREKARAPQKKTILPHIHLTFIRVVNLNFLLLTFIVRVKKEEKIYCFLKNL